MTHQEVLMKQALMVAAVPPLGVKKVKRVAAVLHALEGGNAGAAAAGLGGARGGLALEERGEPGALARAAGSLRVRMRARGGGELGKECMERGARHG